MSATDKWVACSIPEDRKPTFWKLVAEAIEKVPTADVPELKKQRHPFMSCSSFKVGGSVSS